MGDSIVVLGPTYEDSFSRNIAETLARVGIPVHHLDTRGSVASMFKAGTGAPRPVQIVESLARRAGYSFGMKGRIEARLRKIAPAVVLSTVGGLPPEWVQDWQLASPGSTWALWYPDHLANLGAQEAISAGYHHLFFKDPYLVRELRRATTLPAALLQEACNPGRHHPVKPTKEERRRYACDVALAGNMYPYRAKVLESVPEQMDLRLYGKLVRTSPRWIRDRAFVDEYVVGRRKSLAYGLARIVLNTLHFAEVESVNARLFEAAACGAFILTPARPVLGDLFTIGAEVLAYSSKAEMRSLLQFWLQAPDEERLGISNQARRRAMKFHNYEARLEVLLHEIGCEDIWPATDDFEEDEELS